MKFLCTHCSRLVELERFSLDGSTLVVTCSSCGDTSRATAVTPPAPAAVSTLPPAAVATSPAPQRNIVALRTPTVEAITRAAEAAKGRPFDVPEGHCPKCISKRISEALACPNCGLTFATAIENAFAPSEWLQEQWLGLLQAWGEDSRHEALRAQAMSKDELAQLGRLYRLRLASFPSDPYAGRGRDEVLRLAVLPHVTAQKLKVGEQQTPAWKYVLPAGVIFACLVALFFLVRQLLTPS